jgi:hypothetical protein
MVLNQETGRCEVKLTVPQVKNALLLLYYCFTTVLLLLYYCSTTAFKLLTRAPIAGQGARENPLHPLSFRGD